MKEYRIDQACALPMLVLERAGVFDSGPDDRSWLCAWRSGATLVSSLRLRWLAAPEMSALWLDFTTHQKDGRRVHHEYAIPIYCGRERSFLCPVLSDGRRCLRRCRVQYRPPEAEYFGCRQCHHLTAARHWPPRKSTADLAADLATAEQALVHARSLVAIPPAVERVAAVRKMLTKVLRAEIERSHEIESLGSAVETLLHGPQPTTRTLLRCYAKLSRAQREDQRALLNDLGIFEPAALRLEVTPLSV